MHDVQFLCNLKRLNILVPMFPKYKIRIERHSGIQIFCKFIWKLGLNPSVASMILDWINSSTITCQFCWRHES